MINCYRNIILLVLFTLIIGTNLSLSMPPGSNSQTRIKAPKVKTEPFKHNYYGKIIDDPYQWIMDKGSDSLDVNWFLKNEADYAREILKKSKTFKTQIINELIERTSHQATYAWSSRNYRYFIQELTNMPYPIYYRQSINVANANKEKILDVNNFGGKPGKVKKIDTEADETLIAFTIGTTDDRECTLYIMNLIPGEIIHKVDNAACAFEWSTTGKSIVYTLMDPSNISKHSLFRYTIANAATTPIIGPDDYNQEVSRIWLRKSSSGQFLFVAKSSNKWYCLHAIDDAFNKLVPVYDKYTKLIRRIDHFNNQFLLALIPFQNQKDSELLVVCDTDKIANIDNYISTNIILLGKYSKTYVFRNHLVIIEQMGLTPKIKVYDFDKNGRLLPNTKPRRINPPGESYTIIGPKKWVYDSDILEYTYTSLITPPTIHWYNMTTGASKTQSMYPITNYKESDYKTEVIIAPYNSRSGTSTVGVPITIAYKRSLMKRDDSNCLWLSGYGAYGIPSRPSFAWNTITLLDFGCVYAIAHVRGGGEFGMQWWHAGSGFNKKNSYNDFIVAADTLVTQGFTRHTRMVIQGKNAGGTMIGAVINKRPDIAKVAILNAPVLDILTAAMDTLDPPADINKSEWGCTSKNKKSYVHIRSYSPYENIKPDVKYPNILVTARHNDPYLKYWNPSKWVAKMRASNVENPEHDNDPHTIIFLMNNNAEHSIHASIADTATELAFVIDKLQKPLGISKSSEMPKSTITASSSQN